MSEAATTRRKGTVYKLFECVDQDGEAVTWQDIGNIEAPSADAARRTITRNGIFSACAVSGWWPAVALTETRTTWTPLDDGEHDEPEPEPDPEPDETPQALPGGRSEAEAIEDSFFPGAV